MIENGRLSYLHLARDDSEEVDSFGIAPEQRGHATESISAAQDPAALSFRSHALQIADMIRAVREDATPLLDGYAARYPVEIILGMYESVRTHKEVTLS